MDNNNIMNIHSYEHKTHSQEDEFLRRHIPKKTHSQEDTFRRRHTQKTLNKDDTQKLNLKAITKMTLPWT